MALHAPENALKGSERPTAQRLLLSAADPLNLIGISTPGRRLAAFTGNRLVCRDGIPGAALSGGKVEFPADLEGVHRWEAKKKWLVRSAARGVLADLV